MMLLRARSLCLGFSGSRPVIALALVDLLNAGITPVVPEHGSLGASGDLAPLAHMSLVLMGEGRAELPDGRVVDGEEALRVAGLSATQLEVKDGLSLINGTDGMLGMLVLALADLDTLLVTADIAAALSTEGGRRCTKWNFRSKGGSKLRAFSLPKATSWITARREIMVIPNPAATEPLMASVLPNSRCTRHPWRGWPCSARYRSVICLVPEPTSRRIRYSSRISAILTRPLASTS
jgi:hypothetical protein